MILGVNHVAISVPDMKQALAFYVDVLGLEKIGEFSWDTNSDSADQILAVKGTAADVTVLKANNILLEIFKFKAGDPKLQDSNRPVIDHGFTHLCFAVKNLEEEYKRLKAAGMEFHCPPVVLAEGVVRTVYGRDPFGNVIELEEVEGRELPVQSPLSM